MTPGDMLRDWAVRLRSVCESADADRATLRLQGGQVVSYELGEGLSYTTADGVTLSVPEAALDDERWTVAGA